MPFQPQKGFEPIEAAEGRAYLRQHIHRRQPRCGITLLFGQFCAHPSDEPAFSMFDRKLAGQVQQVASLQPRLIMAGGLGRRRQFDPAQPEIFFNVHARV